MYSFNCHPKRFILFSPFCCCITHFFVSEDISRNIVLKIVIIFMKTLLPQLNFGLLYSAIPSMDFHLFVYLFFPLIADKFTKEVEPIFPKFRSSEPMREGFVFPNLGGNSMTEAATEGVHEVKHRDVGTEMTPLSSSTPSRCHTPFKSTSPARHNTPENRSGPLAIINSRTTNIAKLQDCHIAKLQIGEQFDSIVSTWSSREEEEEEISKSLRHFDISSDCRKSLSEPRLCSWEEEGKSNCCIR